MGSEEIRVLVVDDSAVVRSIIADSIANTPGMQVVGKAGDGRRALDLYDEDEWRWAVLARGRHVGAEEVVRADGVRDPRTRIPPTSVPLSGRSTTPTRPMHKTAVQAAITCRRGGSFGLRKKVSVSRVTRTRPAKPGFSTVPSPSTPACSATINIRGLFRRRRCWMYRTCASNATYPAIFPRERITTRRSRADAPPATARTEATIGSS